MRILLLLLLLLAGRAWGASGVVPVVGGSGGGSATNAVATIKTNGVNVAVNVTSLNITGAGATASGSEVTVAVTGGSSVGTNTAAPDMELVATSGTTAAWLYRNAGRARPPNLTNLVVSGDSIETITGGSTNWPSILTNAYPFLRLRTNSGVASQKMWTIMQNYQNNFGIWAPGTASNTLAILKAGINDVGQGSNAVGLLGNFDEMAVNLHSNGYYVMAVTLAASGGNTFVGQETNRILYNAMLRTNKNWDYLFDAANYIPHTSLWYSNDMIHPNNLGKGLYAMGVMDVMNAGLKNPQATQPMQGDNSGPFMFAGMRDTNSFKALSYHSMFQVNASPSMIRHNGGDDTTAATTTASGNDRFYALAAGDVSIDFPTDLYLEMNTTLAALQTPRRFQSSNTISATLGFIHHATNIVAAPAGLAAMGAHLWSDGTNLCVVLQNSAGTRTTNKLTMSAWP